MNAEERAIWDRLSTEQPIADVTASSLGLGILVGDPRVVVARRGGIPVAIIALATAPSSWRRLYARRLVSAGDLYWTCRYPICGRELDADVQTLLEELVAQRGWDELVLGPMLADSRIAHALVATGTAMGMRPVVTEAGRASRVVFDGTWQAYWASRSGKLRAQISHGEKLLAKLGPVSFEQVRSGPRIDDALDAFFAVEATGWKLAERSAIACDPAVRARYVALAHEAASRGQLRLFRLCAGDHVVAASYCIEHGHDVYQLKTGYDHAHAKRSPGNVLHKRIIDALWAEGGCHSFDFMPGGGEHGGYKERWANDVRRYSLIELFRPRRARGQLLAGLVHVKRALDTRSEQHT